MKIENTERRTITSFFLRMSHNQFDAFLSDVCGSRISEFCGPADDMTVVCVRFIWWLEQVPVIKLMQVCDGAITCFAADKELEQAFSSMKARVARAEVITANQAAWDATLVSSVPVINRLPLRSSLRKIIERGEPKVVLVNGPKRSGRSHSWFLINHVARSVSNVLPIKLDVTANTLEDRTIDTLFSYLSHKLGLFVRKPTTTGATIETIAARFADAIASACIDRAKAEKSYWIVFDSIDKDTLPEVSRFICELARLCLSDELPNCHLFLLGAGRDFGIDDPYQVVLAENIGTFLEPEVQAAAKAINSLGITPKIEQELNQWIKATWCESLLLAHSSEFLSSRMVELRLDVGA